MNTPTTKPFELHRRDVLRHFGAVAIGGLAGTHAQAQHPYPSRPVTVILPSAPGAPSDLLARKLSVLMGDKAGQPFIADNRPGANGLIGVPAL